jgi:hypothetical protein
MLTSIDGKEIDPKQIDHFIRGGIQGKEKLTGVVLKDKTEQWLKHTCDDVLKAMNTSRCR